MVKVLMAHGFGTNAAIFEAQTGMSCPQVTLVDYTIEKRYPQSGLAPTSEIQPRCNWE